MQMQQIRLEQCTFLGIRSWFLETIVQALRDPRTADALEPSRLCATVGTKFERCPERLMVELISALLEGEATEGWSRDPSFQSEVYRFAGD